MSLQAFTRLSIFATCLALLVVLLGAYLRLSHAGLQCPDVSECADAVRVTRAERLIEPVNAPQVARVLELLSVRSDTAHRYVALALGLLVVCIAVAAWRRRNRPGQSLAAPLLALGLVGLQGASGIWLAALLPAPLFATLHLLAGLTVAAMLWWIALRHGGLFTGYSRPLLGTGRSRFTPWVMLGLLLLYGQLLLGGWVSANHAAFACADFPLCQGELLPALDLETALRPWRASGTVGGADPVEVDAGVTIHLLHRAGALVVLVYLGLLAWGLLRGEHDERLKSAGSALALVLLLQTGLGIATVMLGPPLPVAVAHSAGAALLLLTLVTVYHVTVPPRPAV